MMFLSKRLMWFGNVSILMLWLWFTAHLQLETNLLTLLIDYELDVLMEDPASGTPEDAAAARWENASDPMMDDSSAHTTNTQRRAPPIAAPVEWLQDPDISLDDGDMFSASWFMSKQMFLESPPVEKIGYVEGACFAMIRDRTDKVRMPLDWLDFSVEHMSMWWKIILDIDDGVDDGSQSSYAYALKRIVSILEQYRLERSPSSSIGERREGGGGAYSDPYHTFDRSILRPTIALISFQQYKLNKKKIKNGIKKGGRQLTVSSLSATIASLIRVGMGRVVVVGHEEGDEEVVHEAFGLLSDYIDSYGDTELAFAHVTDEMVYSKFDDVNIPKASLMGVRRAIVGDDPEWTRLWLGDGDPSRWKYIYLTEPDTLLHTRPSTLPYLEQALQEGLILVPHRIQPIPYYGDFPKSKNLETFVPSEFKTPITLDALAGQVCCDEQAGSYKPGKPPFMKKCPNNFWWRCGFMWSRHTDKNHSRLEHYDFMRLQQGTGVVTLAGTEHGRRCIPKQEGQCERKMSVNHPDHPDNPWKKQLNQQDDNA